MPPHGAFYVPLGNQTQVAKLVHQEVLLTIPFYCFKIDILRPIYFQLFLQLGYVIFSYDEVQAIEFWQQ